MTLTQVLLRKPCYNLFTSYINLNSTNIPNKYSEKVPLRMAGRSKYLI